MAHEKSLELRLAVWTVSYTSNRPQYEIGNYSGLYTNCFRLHRLQLQWLSADQRTIEAGPHSPRSRSGTHAMYLVNAVLPV